MKGMLKYLLLGLAVSLIMAGCAKPPTQEMSDAQSAIDASAQEGASVYGKDELRNLNDLMAQANEQIKAQEGKLFKKYDEAKATLARAKSEAEALKAAIPARKEEAKQKAIAAAAAAEAAVKEAKGLLAKAPKGKGTKADIDMMTSELKAAEEMLPGIQQSIAAEDFFGAADKAKAIADKAAAVSQQVKKAMEKTGRK